MQKYIGTAIKKDVNNPSPVGETPAVNVDVRVVVTSTGAPANIYSDNGTTLINQDNYKTDANGNHEFYAANGRYTVRYLLAGETIEYTDISLFDVNDYTPPGGGEANTSSNQGAGAGLALPKSGVDLPFKSLLVTGGATITEQANTVTIDVSGVGGDMLKATYDPTNQNTDAFANDAIYNNQTGSSYTITPADRGKTVSIESASANTVTIDTNANQSCPANMVCLIAQDGTGQTTLNSVAGVTVNGQSGDLFSYAFDAQYKAISIEQKSINNWIVRGI